MTTREIGETMYATGLEPMAGTLSIESRNVFSILKKWLYTEQGVVFRELVSNASDAVAKLASLVAAADHQAPQGWSGRIDVVVDAANQTLQISDNGLGMTADELDRYINRIAFSGATEFVNQFADREVAADEAIIGRFGVGFYSAFMISDQVSIDTCSHQADAEPVYWECDGDMAFTMGLGDRAEVGTTVTLQLADDSPYLTDPEHAAAALRKYFAFLPTPIRYTFVPAASSAEPPTSAEPAEATSAESSAAVPSGSHDSAPHDYAAELINDPDPIWARPAGSVDPDELKAFYRDYFNDDYDPLFWLRIISPDLGLRGIIFFRNTRLGTEELDGRIDVLSRGVHIESNSRSLIPKFVNLQSGIIECDRLPLVVSRSQVRSDEADDDIQAMVFEALAQEMSLQLYQMFTEHRADYEKHWPEIGPFVKYGVLTDRTFASVMGRRMLFETLTGELQTIAEYLPTVEAIRPNTVFYASDSEQQGSHIDLFRRNAIPALVLDHVIDQPLMRRLELTNKGVSFHRLDAELTDVLELPMTGEDEALGARAETRFRTVLGARLGEVDLRPMKFRDTGVSTLISMDEATRRMGDMMEIYGLVSGVGPRADTVPRVLLINLTNPLVRRAVGVDGDPRADEVITQLFDLALLNQGELDPKLIPDFLRRSEQILATYLEEN